MSPRFDFSNLKSLIEKIQLKIFSDNTKTENIYHVDNSTKTINLNISGVTPTDKEQLAELLRVKIDEGNTLIDEKSVKIIEDFREEEQGTYSVEIINFFQNKVSSIDLKIIRGALYIQKLADNGKDFQEIKNDLIERYGERARNISNMCGEGYFNRYFIPYYNLLMSTGTEEEDAIASFNQFFNVVVRELPFTVFVCQMMAPKEVYATITQKVSKLRSYGFQHINIHGIGKRNMEVIRKAIDDVLEEHKLKKVITTDTPQRLSVRMEILPIQIKPNSTR